MKKGILVIGIALLLSACVATNKPLEDRPIQSIDPQVTKWLEKTPPESSETLPIVLLASEPVPEYSFLRKVKGNYYTGHVTHQQLKKLLLDDRILRIASGKQKLHHK